VHTKSQLDWFNLSHLAILPPPLTASWLSCASWDVHVYDRCYGNNDARRNKLWHIRQV